MRQILPHQSPRAAADLRKYRVWAHACVETLWGRCLLSEVEQGNFFGTFSDRTPRFRYTMSPRVILHLVLVAIET